MELIVNDSFTGGGTLASHIGELGANWAAGQAAAKTLQLYPNLATNLSLINLADGGVMLNTGTIYSSGLSSFGECFAEAEVAFLDPAASFASGRIELALHDITRDSFSDKLTVRALCLFDAYKDDALYGRLESYNGDSRIDFGSSEAIPPPVWGYPTTYRMELAAGEIRLLVNGILRMTLLARPEFPFSALGSCVTLYTGNDVLTLGIRAGSLGATPFWSSLIAATEEIA